MYKHEKEIIQAQLDKEKAVLDELEHEYSAALKQINEKIMILQSDTLTQSRIYQLQYQKALKGQVQAILEKLHADEYSTIQQYLSDSYSDSFIAAMYSFHKQKVPIILPIDKKAAVKAVLTDSKIKGSLYEALGINVEAMKKSISQEITRGIASGLSYSDIIRNLRNATKAPMANAKTIVRTEGHRIQQASTEDARQCAKAKGADVVKQWDATMDGATRPTHQRLDGQIKETHEPFEYGSKKAMYPGDFGDPAEDCNCRCVALTRARWALDEDELETMKARAEYFGLDKSDSFEEFKEKYLKAAEKPKTIDGINLQATDALLNAYDERRVHFGMTSVSADELRKSKMNPFTADYTGVSVETAEAFNDTITRLSEDYYTGFTRIEVADPKEVFGAQEFATTRHLNSVGQKTLVINPLKTKDYGKMVEKIEELSQKGYAVKIEDGKAGEYIATHEFAHSLLDIGGGSLKNYVGLDVKPLQKARKEIEEVFAEYAKEVNTLERAFRELEGKMILADDLDDMATLQKEAKKAKERLDKIKISRYSMQNADEFMAESFVNVKIGKEPSPWSEKAVSILDKYFKKNQRNAPEALNNQGKNGIIKLGNSEVRKWYLDSVSRIPDSIDSSLPMLEKAKKAFEARNRIRTEARNMMADEKTRKLLEQERPNKTFEELIKSKMERKGMTREEAIEDIYKTATKTNANVNKELGLEE